MQQGKLAGKHCHRPINTIASTSVVSHQSTCTRYEFPGRFAQFHPLDLVDSRPWVLRLLFLRLIAKQVDFITRIKSNAAFEVERILSSDYARDRLICFKTGDKNQPLLRLRLVEVQGKTMYGYITSVLDHKFFHRMPLLTSTDDGGELKRLSILNACWLFIWTGSINGVKLQVWTTWLFYAVLIDLADAVADELAVPFDRISFCCFVVSIISIMHILRAD